MRVFVGQTGHTSMVQDIKEYGWGRIFVGRTPHPFEGESWAWDSGAFSSFLAGESIAEYESKLSRRIAQLEQFVDREHPSECSMAVLPDVVGQCSKSLEMSISYYDKLRHRLPDVPWYFAVQDGMEDLVPDVVAILSEGASGLFLGGTDRTKRLGVFWSEIAHDCNKPLHYGRAGTLRKIRHAKACADSLDSSFPLWTMERWNTFCHWMQHADPQLSFGLSQPAGEMEG